MTASEKIVNARFNMRIPPNDLVDDIICFRTENILWRETLPKGEARLPVQAYLPDHHSFMGAEEPRKLLFTGVNINMSEF